MSTEVLELFEFEDKQVRTIMQDGEPWFVLADVCKVLDLRVAKVKERLTPEDVNVLSRDVYNGAGRAPLLVNESGLYDAILDSRKPQAKQFRRWITSEVLPALRKDGVYVTEELAEESPDVIMAKAVLAAQKTLELKEAKIQELNEELEEQKPLVDFAETIKSSNELKTFTHLAKLLNSAGCSINRNELCKQLRDEGFLYKRPGMTENLPIKQYEDQGLFKTKYVYIEQADRTTVQTYLTGAGIAYFIDYFLND